MQRASIVPYLHPAARWVEKKFAAQLPGADLFLVTRHMLSYDFAMLRLLRRPCQIDRVGGMAAQLLFLAERIEMAGGGSLVERDDPVSVGDDVFGAFESDSTAMGAALRRLTQADVASAIAHLWAVADMRNVDVLVQLSVLLKRDRVAEVLAHEREIGMTRAPEIEMV